MMHDGLLNFHSVFFRHPVDSCLAIHELGSAVRVRVRVNRVDFRLRMREKRKRGVRVSAG